MNRKTMLLTCLSQATQQTGVAVTAHSMVGDGDTVALRNAMLNVLTVCSMLREEGIELFNFASNADMRYMRDKEREINEYLRIYKL